MNTISANKCIWIEELPEHWQIRKAKFLLTQVKRPVKVGDGVVTCFRDGQVTLRSKRRLTGFTESIFRYGYQHIEPGDLVIHQMDAFAGAIGVSDSSGCSTPAYAVCVPTGDISAKYAALATREMARSNWIQALSRGIRERSTDFRFAVFADQYLPLPPKDEQEKIVRYLDHAEMRIAKAIQAKQKMVALLNEQKQVIISELVTRGLNPNVPMKDSGQAWLGQIPAHWEVVRLGSVLEERTEMNDKEQVTQVLSLLRKRGVMLYEDKGRVGNKKSENIRRYKIVRENDIVVNCMNVIIGSVGLSSYVGCLSPVYYVLKARTESTSSAYFNNVFQIEPFHKSLVRYGKGILAHRMRISMLDLKAVLVPKPPFSEQAEINEAISSRTVGIDGAVAAVEREIELLKEYRTVLISDVVTGKKDVRAEAAGLQDVDPAELAQVLSGAVSVDAEVDEDDGTSEVE